MIVLDFCAEITLVLMVTTHVNGNPLEYLFAVCTVIKVSDVFGHSTRLKTNAPPPWGVQGV